MNTLPTNAEADRLEEQRKADMERRKQERLAKKGKGGDSHG